MPTSSRASSRSLAAGLVFAGSLLLAPAVASATPPAAAQAGHPASAAVPVSTSASPAAQPVAGARVNPAYPDPSVSNGKWGLIGLTGMFGLFGYRAYTARRRPERETEGERR